MITRCNGEEITHRFFHDLLPFVDDSAGTYIMQILCQVMYPVCFFEDLSPQTPDPTGIRRRPRSSLASTGKNRNMAAKGPFGRGRGEEICSLNT